MSNNAPLNSSQRKKFMGKLLLNLPPSPYAEIAKNTEDSEIFVRRFFKGDYEFDSDHRIIKAAKELIIKTNAKRSKDLEALANLCHEINNNSFKAVRKRLLEESKK